MHVRLREFSTRLWLARNLLFAFFICWQCGDDAPFSYVKKRRCARDTWRQKWQTLAGQRKTASGLVWSRPPRHLTEVPMTQKKNKAIHDVHLKQSRKRTFQSEEIAGLFFFARKSRDTYKSGCLPESPANLWCSMLLIKSHLFALAPTTTWVSSLIWHQQAEKT